ncbi:hypothetical protein [Mesorhizobium sp. B2-4-19]|uniref:hypothetical protein n=1 Tax=Mesorhizobium sp. B2-4-19 TaxID=2589930 RepID=UPI001FEF3E83|nr:hypothetical protein [Mesorhizobium sp. B2-4-19]
MDDFSAPASPKHRGVALGKFDERRRPHAEHVVRRQVHPRFRPSQPLGQLFVQRIGEAGRNAAGQQIASPLCGADIDIANRLADRLRYKRGDIAHRQRLRSGHIEALAFMAAIAQQPEGHLGDILDIDRRQFGLAERETECALGGNGRRAGTPA